MCDYKKQGITCADNQNAIEGMKALAKAAENCKTKDDYVSFMKNALHIDAEEVVDGIILRLHKTGCTCSNPECIQKCGADLCQCTKAHEEYTWSVFFGKPIKAEIMESFCGAAMTALLSFLCNKVFL